MNDFEEFAELERSGWSEPDRATHYAADFGKAAAMCAGPLVDAVDARPGGDFLDLCSGHGIVASALVKAGGRVTALDFSPAMLEIAAVNAPGAALVEADAADTGLADASFDGITIGHGIPHLPNPEAALAECHRLLKPGGRLAYTSWQRPGPMTGIGMVTEAIGALGDVDALPPGPDFFAFAEMSVATRALEPLGFEDVTETEIPAFWEVESPGAPYDFFEQGAVRIGKLLLAQPDEVRAAIRQSVRDKVLDYFGPAKPWRIPMPAVMIAATRR